jgi:hypothetical protein
VPVDGDDDEALIEELCCSDDQGRACDAFVASVPILPFDDVELGTPIAGRFYTYDKAGSDDTHNVEDVNLIDEVCRINDLAESHLEPSEGLVTLSTEPGWCLQITRPLKFGLLKMFRKVMAGSDEGHSVQGKEEENVVRVNDGVGSGQQQFEDAIANETTSTGCILDKTIAGDDLAGGSVAIFVASPLEKTDEEESFTFSDYSIAPKPLQSSGFESDALWI